MNVEVYLSTDFSRTCWGMDAENFEEARADGVYPRHPNVVFEVDTDSCEVAGEVAFAVCNSYPEELHCTKRYASVVERYRVGGNRSLSVGDLVTVDGDPYGCVSVGFVALGGDD